MEKLLIANRGEIAVRVARTAKAMGLRTVAVVSEADRTALITRVADEVVVIGPAPAAASYLDQDAVLAAAEASGADAVHPGYGFLSERARFAERVIDAGLTWVGPDPKTIHLMGDKVQAIGAAASAGVPVLPGSDGPVGSLAAADEVAQRIGYPVVLKASAGGGGRGIRVVRDAHELRTSFDALRSEAESAFGDGTVYLERFVADARHLEVQVVGDGHCAIHLGDRDCSMQRRSQKVLEEAPAPEVPDHVREVVQRSAVALAESCGYRGVGTVEYLYDSARQEAYFIEMNTRLQVEHPVTEAVTGVDLVELQLLVAQGRQLPLAQEDVHVDGHALEFRINAEDPSRNFFPSPGTITELVWPQDARVDSGFEQGDTVPPYYDSLVAKVIIHAPDRESAIAKGRAALSQVRLEGISTTLPLHLRLLETPELAQVRHHTTFIETALDA